MSDQVAADLARGDECDADRHANELRQRTIEAIGDVPAALREELTSQVNALAERIECTPPPAPATTEDEDEDDHKGKNGKGKNGNGENGNGGKG